MIDTGLCVIWTPTTEDRQHIFEVLRSSLHDSSFRSDYHDLLLYGQNCKYIRLTTEGHIRYCSSARRNQSMINSIYPTEKMLHIDPPYENLEESLLLLNLTN